jgi:hypothetical protein
LPLRRIRAWLPFLLTVCACGGRSDLLLLETGGGDAAAGGDASRDAWNGSDTGADSTSLDAGLDVLDAARPDAGLDVLDAARPDAGPPPTDGSVPPSSCNATTCPEGCCSADGTCVMSNALNACGFGGEPCESCPPGDFCKGACVHWQADCNPSNCNGCCANQNLCSTGVSDYNCGQGGGGCQRCVPGEGSGHCVPQAGGGGLCNGVVSCTAQNCPGCCAGEVCMAGDTNDACGNKGAPCHACGGDLQCNGECVDAGSCGPWNCPGCCAGLGCAYGNQDTACGAGGAACDDCSSAGQTCVANACQ